MAENKILTAGEKYAESRQKLKENMTQYEIAEQARSVAEELEQEITHHQQDLVELDTLKSKYQYAEEKIQKLQEDLEKREAQLKYQSSYISNLEKRPLRKDERVIEEKIQKQSKLQEYTNKWDSLISEAVKGFSEEKHKR